MDLIVGEIGERDTAQLQGQSLARKGIMSLAGGGRVRWKIPDRTSRGFVPRLREWGGPLFVTPLRTHCACGADDQKSDGGRVVSCGVHSGTARPVSV